MVDLFAGIPDTTIESTLRMIKGNLDKVGLYGGHTLRRHTDIQVMVLKSRLTREDIRFATSFWDMEVAIAVAQGIMRQFYDEEIAYWLRGKYSDVLPLASCFPETVGYIKKRGGPAGGKPAESLPGAGERPAGGLGFPYPDQLSRILGEGH